MIPEGGDRLVVGGVTQGRGLASGGGGYLRAGASERGEDARVDEAELGLDFVAAQVVDRLAVLVQNQVLSVGSKPKMDGHTVVMVSFGGHSCPRSGHLLGVLKRASDLSSGHPKWPDTAQVLLRAQFKACGKPGTVPGLGTREHEGARG